MWCFYIAICAQERHKTPGSQDQCWEKSAKEVGAAGGEWVRWTGASEYARNSQKGSKQIVGYQACQCGGLTDQRGRFHQLAVKGEQGPERKGDMAGKETEFWGPEVWV